MSKGFFLILATTMLCTLSCSNEKTKVNLENIENNSSKKVRQTESCHDIECMQEYVENNAELFGEHVFIFETIEDAIDYVDYLSTLTLQNLISIYDETEVNSPVLNSIIYWELGEELYSITNMSEEDMLISDDQNYDAFYQYLSANPLIYLDTTFEDAYWDEYLSSYFIPYEPIAQVIEGTETEPLIGNSLQRHIMPLGGFDLTALLNEKNVFVAGGCAYTKLKSKMVHVPIESYFDYFQCSDEFEVNDLLEELEDMDLDGGTTRIVTDKADIPTPTYIGATGRGYYIHDNHFKLNVVVDFDYSRYWWFGRYTKRRMQLGVENFVWKNNTWYHKRLQTNGSVSCFITDGHSSFQFSFDEVNRKIGNKTFHKLYDIVPQYCYEDYISNISISMTNHHVTLTINN